jgi:hypothetical protein
VNGKLGLSFGEASGADLPSDARQATGRKRSVMAGIGAEYQPWDRIALWIRYDLHSKLSDGGDTGLPRAIEGFCA